MGRLTREEKEVIAYNISEQRKRKYPGHGGGKKCAAEFGVPPQQWSPWESGSRTPDDNRLAQIAQFFRITITDLRQEPGNWAKIFPGWLATKRKSRKRDMAMLTEMSNALQSQSSAAPVAPDSGNADLMAILRLFTASHGKVEAGEMGAADYAGRVRQILDFAKYILEK